MDNKRGISGVITTILLVGLVLVAIFITWGFIQPILTGTGGEIALSSACLKLDLEPLSCSYDQGSGEATIRYKRGSGNPGMNLTGVSVVVDLATGDSQVETIRGNDVADQLETKSVTIGVDDDATAFTVVGLLTGDDGSENPCPETAGKISCVAV